MAGILGMLMGALVVVGWQAGDATSQASCYEGAAERRHVSSPCSSSAMLLDVDFATMVESAIEQKSQSEAVRKFVIRQLERQSSLQSTP